MSTRSGSSFDRIFARSAGESGASGGGEDEPPSLHELFSAAMQDRLSLPQFARLLVELHGVHLTPAAARLLSSVDAASGRLSFAQFQRALHEGAEEHGVLAGRPNVFEDQAAAIIADNCGAPAAPAPLGATKVSTDISADREAFARRFQEVERRQARGAFSGNPVVPTNRVSSGNPLAHAGGDGGTGDDPYGARGMANTATRMYVSGDLDRGGYEKFLDRFGIQLTSESELRRLIVAHEQVGNGSFSLFARALQKELARVEAGSAAA